MSGSRERILARLRGRRTPPPPPPASDMRPFAAHEWTQEERVERFRSAIESVHGEVHRVAHDGWITCLLERLQARGITNLLAPADTALGRELRHAWPADGPELLRYDRPIEDWKPELFHQVQAGLTAARGGIAETGSLILWPGPGEPRLASLVPPVHIAVLDADQLHTTLLEAMRAQHWARGMPTNALLISGPSKTADIEQTLAYGVHGPRELIVLVRE
ncbi:MAG: lactate utilization protein [Ectothiorhodospiraceae bacterium]|nr:lactate utilization protein [Ectothiorhodospiraceae bacterium]